MATELKIEDLEKQLESMLDIEKFPPPEDFRNQALVTEESMYEEAERDLEGFWSRQADELLDWAEQPTQVLDESNAPFYKWFAYHWRGEEGEQRDITYAELHRDVQRCANALKDRGIGKGDVVGIYLPMIPEVVIAMLACARIGAPHNVVFGGFSPEAVREGMEFSEAKTLITVDGARRKGKTAPIKSAVDEVMPDLPCIVVRHTGTDAPMAAKDVWFDELMEAADPECPAEPLDAEHPLYILYTSGSTAKPKGILHTTGGYL